MKFVNKAHEDRFESLVKKDGTVEGDAEREAFFYLIAHNVKLFNEIEELYDFSKRRAKIRHFDKEIWNDRIENYKKYNNDEKVLIKLALSLLGDRYLDGLGPYQIFNDWAEGEKIVILTALSIRFSMKYGIFLLTSFEELYYDHYLNY